MCTVENCRCRYLLDTVQWQQANFDDDLCGIKANDKFSVSHSETATELHISIGTSTTIPDADAFKPVTSNGNINHQNLHISRASLPPVPGVPGRGGAGVGQQVGLQPVPARVQVPAAPSRVTCHVSRVAAIKVYSAMWNLICKVWWCGLSCPVPGLIFLKVPSCQNGCYHPWLMTRAFKGEREWENVAKMWIVSPLYNCILPGWRPPSLRSPGPGPGIIIKCSRTFT